MSDTKDILLLTRNLALQDVLCNQLPTIVPVSCHSAKDIKQAAEIKAKHSIILGLFDPIIENNSSLNDIPWLNLAVPIRLDALAQKIENIINKQSDVVKLPLDSAGEYVCLLTERVLKHVRSGAQESITEKEMQLVLQLHRAGSAGITRQALREAVWGYDDDIDTHTLETHVYRLRTKLRRLMGQNDAIMSTESGYRLSWDIN